MADRTQNLRQREKGQIIRAFSWIKARWLNAEGQNTGNEQPQSRDALKTKIPPKVNYKSELLKTFFFFFYSQDNCALQVIYGRKCYSLKPAGVLAASTQ